MEKKPCQYPEFQEPGRSSHGSYPEILGRPCYYSKSENKEAQALNNFFIELQLELNAFRAQWMSELKSGSGASGLSGRLLRTKGLKRTQDIAREEKVSCAMISPGHVL